MKEFFNKLRDSLLRFMDSRYGGDHLGMAIVILAIICSLIASIGGWAWLSMVATVLIVASIFRVLSKDVVSRSRENDAFLALIAKPRSYFRRQKAKWDNRKTKAYVRCPYCHAEFALPKGKGKLRATCPKCGQKSEHTV